MGVELDIITGDGLATARPLGRRGLLMERYRHLRKLQGRIFGSITTSPIGAISFVKAASILPAASIKTSLTRMMQNVGIAFLRKKPSVA